MHLVHWRAGVTDPTLGIAASLRRGAFAPDPALLSHDAKRRIAARKKGRADYPNPRTLAIERSLSLGKYL
eukprot:SAG22_NODE_1048_length_5851_cov_33.333449_3_plen_70_part_00